MAGEHRYVIVRNPKPEEYCGKEPVGLAQIVDTEDGEIIAWILHDENSAKQNKMDMAATRINDVEGASHYAIVVSSNYRELVFDKSFEKTFEALAMHELGHMINGDIDRPDDEIETVREKRASFIRNGVVEPEEAAADAFACKQVGKHAMNMALDFLIKRRRGLADKKSDMALKEFMLREKAIKRLVL